MGPLLSIRSARLEKWAVSHGGLRTGCLAAKEDGVSVATQVHRAEHRRVQAGVKLSWGFSANWVMTKASWDGARVEAIVLFHVHGGAAGDRVG